MKLGPAEAGDLMPPGSFLVHPGTVRAAVLAPVDVSDWRESDFHEGVEGVRQRFVDTLEHWPEG